MTFHSVGNVIPTDELHHFSEGLVETTNQIFEVFLEFFQPFPKKDEEMLCFPTRSLRFFEVFQPFPAVAACPGRYGCGGWTSRLGISQQQAVSAPPRLPVTAVTLE